jgi:hypothetical protein
MQSARMAINGFPSVEESEVAAIENKDYYNRFLTTGALFTMNPFSNVKQSTKNFTSP